MAKNHHEIAKPRKVDIAVSFPFSTIAVVLATLLFVKTTGYLLPLFMPLLLGAILAVSLAPIVSWLESKKISKSISLIGLTLLLALAICGGTTILLPRLLQEGEEFMAHLPQLKQEVLSLFPESGGVRNLLEHALSHQTTSLRNIDSGSLLSAGHLALGGIGEFLLILIFAVYLLADGTAIIAWISAFFNHNIQRKLHATAKEVSQVVFAYVLGQAITSLLSFIYVLFVLKTLKVPAALLLAVLAGLFDVLPVLGFFMAVVPAMLFALKVSTPTAVIVFACYLAYHAIENYIIVPAVYGNRLRISTFVVLLSLLAAGLLAGIEGAIAALPIVASYPIIEKIWLPRYVGEETLKEHARIEA